MNNRIDNLPQILSDMGVCATAKTKILVLFGNRPKVTKANLRKAIKFRGAMWFMNFVQHWMKMDYELKNWILNKRDHRIWNQRYWNESHPSRVKAGDNVVLEAVYAYYQEWRKP